MSRDPSGWVPFARPSLATLVDRVRNDLRGRLEILGPLLRRAMADILGSVWGGGLHENYGFLDWMSRQLFALTAEEAALLIIAKMFGITRIPAQFASGTATATGTPGTPIPVDTTLKLDADTSYRVTTGQVVGGGGSVVLPIAAVLAGAAANVPAAAVLTFENPIAGVNPTATVDADIEDGADQEDVEALRVRVLDRLRKPPTGGSDQDYIRWAKEVAGVTRAWVYRNELGLGTVVVRFVRDGDVSIFPSAGEVAAVQDKLDAERPVTDEPSAMAPVDLPVAFTIALTPSNAETQAAVQAQLVDLFARGRPGGTGGLGTVLLSQIRTAIGNAAGVTDYVLTAPAVNVVPANGELPTVSLPITWM